MLKTTNKPAFSKNDDNRSASNRNNDSRPVSRRNDGNGEVNGFGGNSMKHAKMSEKSKGQKIFKSQKLDKLEKNSSKSGNSLNFGATEIGLSFLIHGAREAFNRLQLAFTKALIFQHFDPEYHIQIKTDTSSYAIGGVLCQLASGTRSDRVATKTDLGQ